MKRLLKFKEFFENSEPRWMDHEEKETEFFNSWRPKREFWIVDGKIYFDQLGSFGEDDYFGVHTQLALEWLAKKYIPCVLSYAEKLGINKSDLNLPRWLKGKTLEEKFEELGVKNADLLFKVIIEAIKQKVSNNEIWPGIKSQCSNLDPEGYSELLRGGDPKYYLMEKENWILWRYGHIELYGFNRNKFEIIRKIIPEIAKKYGEAPDPEDYIEVFDHKNKKSMQFQVKDYIEGNMLRPQSPESTTKSNVALPIPQGKKYGIELWRGTGD